MNETGEGGGVKNSKPLPDGNVLIEFLGDDGTTINTQVVTADVVRRMPLVAVLLDVAMRNRQGRRCRNGRLTLRRGP